MPSKRNKRRRRIARFNYVYDYPDTSNVSSATDCTGLMPTPPLFDEEFSSYQELCGMQVPKIEPDQRIHPDEGGEKKDKDKEKTDQDE